MRLSRSAWPDALSDLVRLPPLSLQAHPPSLQSLSTLFPFPPAATVFCTTGRSNSPTPASVASASLPFYPCPTSRRLSQPRHCRPSSAPSSTWRLQGSRGARPRGNARARRLTSMPTSLPYLTHLPGKMGKRMGGRRSGSPLASVGIDPCRRPTTFK